MAATKGKKKFVGKSVEEKKAQVEALRQKIVEGVKNITTGDDWKKQLQFASKFHHYSFNNQLLIMCQRPDATRVAGFGTWKSVGRSVRKGEKGIAILAPVIVKKEEKDELTGERVEKKVLVGYRTTYVFDISQTDGEPVVSQNICNLLEGDAPLALWNALVDIAAAEGFTVERGDCGSANGYCDYSTHRIRVRNGISELQAAKTLTHEVAHALMHGPESVVESITETRLSRKQKEVEAESVAFIVLSALDLDTSAYSFGYVTSWSQGDTKLIEKTANRVSRFAHGILDRIEQTAAANNETEQVGV